MAEQAEHSEKAAATDSEGRIRARNEAQILQVAVQLFSSKGFEGTTISEIASVSGLPKANIYYYFPTKSAIYERLIAEVLRDWDTALCHIRADRDPKAALTDYVTEKLEFSRRNSAQSKFFAGELLRGGNFLTDDHRRQVQLATREACAVVEAWVTAGLFPDVDPRHLFIMLWATTQFYSDFAPMAAATLDVKKLRKADFQEASAQIVKIICL